MCAHVMGDVPKMHTITLVFISCLEFGNICVIDCVHFGAWLIIGAHWVVKTLNPLRFLTNLTNIRKFLIRGGGKMIC